MWTAIETVPCSTTQSPMLVGPWSSTQMALARPSQRPRGASRHPPAWAVPRALEPLDTKRPLIGGRCNSQECLERKGAQRVSLQRMRFQTVCVGKLCLRTSCSSIRSTAVCFVRWKFQQLVADWTCLTWGEFASLCFLTRGELASLCFVGLGIVC